MVGCDKCTHWFHKICIEMDEIGDLNDYTCLKCIQWQDHLNRNLLDMNFQYREFKSLVNAD
jgi:hypothetical protein